MSDDGGGGSVILRTVRGRFGLVGLFTSSAISFGQGLVTRPRDNRQPVAYFAGGEGGFAHIPNKRAARVAWLPLTLLVTVWRRYPRLSQRFAAAHPASEADPVFAVATPWPP